MKNKISQERKKYLKKAKTNVKFICLTTDEWNEEKKI